MKIKVIGSGSMWTAYNSASYLVDDDIMVDFPNGTCKNLFRFDINPCNINNILLTHFHGDHYFDMPFYLLNKSKNKSKKVNIFCSENGKSKIEKITELAFPKVSEEVQDYLNIKYNFEDKFKVNDYKVEKLLVEHGIKPAYGYIFSGKDKKVGFTGDTTICQNVEYMASICNYMFCDCMFIEGTDKHMGIDMLKELITKYNDCMFVVSHLEDKTRKELIKLNIKNIIVPEDGLEINIK